MDINLKKDEFSEIHNSKELYKWIASELSQGCSCLIGWTDGKGTHYDILFSFLPSHDNTNRRTWQGGIKRYDLFVSVMRLGAFAFEVGNEHTHPRYYSEKLNVGNCPELGDLINGVKKELL